MKNQTKKFYKFEKENNLFEKEIDNIFYWALIRRRINDNISIYNGNLDRVVTINNLSKIDRLISFIEYTKNAFINLFIKIKPAEYVIISHPRKYLIDGKYYDIYIEPIIKKIKSHKSKYLIIDVPKDWHKHYIKRNKNIRYIENFTLVKKLFFQKINFGKYKYEEINELSTKLKQEFNYDGNINKEFKNQMIAFKQDYKYFKKLLKKTKPKKVYCVISYVYPALIAAANDLNIEVEEIQHGAISKEHLGYNYPYNNKIPYFPNSMSIYGDYWYDNNNIPLPKNKIRYIENWLLKKESENREAKVQNMVTFIGQGSYTIYMENIICEFAQKFSEYKVVLKLHPDEFRDWKKHYKEIAKMYEEKKIEVIDNLNTTIYSQLKKTEFVVGIKSTSLFEALCFDCKVILLNVTGIESMDYVLKNKMMPLASNASELNQIIKNNKFNNDNIVTQFYKL